MHNYVFKFNYCVLEAILLGYLLEVMYLLYNSLNQKFGKEKQS